MREERILRATQNIAVDFTHSKHRSGSTSRLSQKLNEICDLIEAEQSGEIPRRSKLTAQDVFGEYSWWNVNGR